MPIIRPFKVHEQQVGEIPSPLVFDTPHSGRLLPEHFKYECSPETLNYLLDNHVEKLLTGLPAKGFPVLEAKIHRACIDLNRFDDEINPDDIKGSWQGPYRESVNTRQGFGLVARECRVKGALTPIYNKRAMPTQAEVTKRIERYMRPYHDALFGLLDKAREHHGYSLYLNMHSMVRKTDPVTADFVLGDLHGDACAPEISTFICDFLTSEGYSAEMNTPYAGAALIKQTAAPHLGKHSLQIEIARDLYMDAETLEFHPEKAEKIKETLEKLAVALETFCLENAAQLKPTAQNTRRLDNS